MCVARTSTRKATRDVISYVRHRTSFGTLKVGDVVAALDHLPDETMIDGEVVVLDREGKPSFNLLQNFRSMESLIVLYAFDVLVHKGKDLTGLPFVERRKILAAIIQPQEHVGVSEVTAGSAAQIPNFGRSPGLESVTAKADYPGRELDDPAPTVANYFAFASSTLALAAGGSGCLL